MIQERKRIKKTCTTCGKIFEVIQSRVLDAKFCSKSCVRHKKEGVIKKCLNCGKEIYVEPKRNKSYCSIFCFHEYARKINKINGKKCFTCGKIKPVTSFYKRTESKNHKGYRSECKTCEINKAKLYQQKNIVKRRIADHKRGMTPKGQFKRYIHSAKRFNKVFKLTLKYFKDNQSKPCFYCGSLETTKAMGIDRINSKIGYTKENCVPCCKKCNLAKFTYPVEEFLTHIFKIATYQKEKNEYSRNGR